MDGMTVFVLSVALALLVSALCSLMEAALLSLSPSQVASISETRPRVGAIWREFKANIERPIAAILILNTTSHTVGAAVAGAQFDRLFGNEWVWAFSLIFTFAMLQFTEILPKGVGVRYNRHVALWMARPLTLLVRLMHPIAVLIQVVNAPFSPRRSPATPPATVEEIAALAGLARLAKEITTEQERIIKRGSRLAHISAGEIMRPRVEIDAIDVDTPPDEVPGAIAMSGFARVPVYEGDLDRIIGFVYIKDLLRHLCLGWPVDVRKMLHPVLLVPRTMDLDQLLELYRRERTQIAIVLDEYGGTEGLVTLEDVLEELIGAIHDEHRQQPQEIVEQEDGTWLVDGLPHLRDLSEAVGQPDLRSAITPQTSTVGGLIQTTLDRLPTTGDSIDRGDLSLEVVEMDGLRIARVRVVRRKG